MCNKEQEIKPVTGFAPPPMSAIATIAAFVGVSAYYFPTMEDPDPAMFANRVFPDTVSINALLGIRLLFTVVCFLGFISAWATPVIICKTPYRPLSKCPRLPFELGGWRKQYPFTSWSWNVLGISFALSTYIGLQVDRGNEVDPWITRLAVILWEIAAPMTLLIGAVVKYALWPAQVAQTGHGDVFKTPRALLQHNANVIMAVAEMALLGGLPVQFSHLSISVLYGSAYVVFAWIMQGFWHGQGPAFLYFFMDTTLGVEHSMALIVLLIVLLVFHGLFCGAESLLHLIGNSLVGHGLFAVALCTSVCRFRD